MSIPPLVCSTPPPPDQCEDDKDDDFDVQYRLSQEEDDEIETYNYGNISAFNDYCQENKEDFKDTEVDPPKLIDKIEENETIKDGSIIEENINNNKRPTSPKYEDVAVEDLNLKIEETIILSDNFGNTDDPDTYGISCIVNHLDSPDKAIVTSVNNDEDSSDDKSQSDINIISVDDNENQQESCVNTADIREENIEKTTFAQPTELTENETKFEELNTDTVKSNTADDFDDFENFQFTTTTATTTALNQNEALPSFENPWDNNETEDFCFGDFKANFESNNIESNTEETQNQDVFVATKELSVVDNTEDDDFGDFDDFKSSVQEEQEKQCSVETQIPHPVSVLNFQCPDNEAQIIESINNILFHIFTEDVPDTGELKPERDLESTLTEVWHHLKLVDERQPYIIQWNNSLGQKSLLKALCIDSRNILFGPKWNYFTPKYAPNLSAAPLQPQKPAASIANTSNSDVITDKKTNTDNTTWSDPFSSDGQEYTYAEALLLDLENLMATLDQMAHKHSTLKISELLSSATSVDKEPASKEIRPADLDVFENAISVTSIDNIHSSTLSVQPLRHINLPDTHIFTPTDSETPRSKTIHYDNGPPILLPQQAIENHNIGHDKGETQHPATENNDDYWEFQDFKGVPDNSTPISNADCLKPADKSVIPPNICNVPSNSSVTYQTQVLQPVKLEPIMPKLNWPDPGEVKETFDNFSDFISNSNWSNGSDDMAAQHMPPDKTTDEKPNKTSIEDEFETFQSAAPAHNHFNHSGSVNTFEHFENLPIQRQMNNVTLKPNKTLASESSQDSSPVLNNANSKNTSNIPMNLHPINHNSILQPINPLSSARSQQGGQILQPLSLESYSQINWPKPGIDLQNLASFNPLESLQLLKSDTGSGGPSKVATPVHSKASAVQNEVSDDDVWGDFVSSKPKEHAPKKTPIFAHDDEWTDFVSSPSLSQNSLNTISFNVQTNSSIQKNVNVNSTTKSNQNISLDIPVLNYITPKSSNRGAYIEKHFQNL